MQFFCARSSSPEQQIPPYFNLRGKLTTIFLYKFKNPQGIRCHEKQDLLNLKGIKNPQIKLWQINIFVQSQNFLKNTYPLPEG